MEIADTYLILVVMIVVSSSSRFSKALVSWRPCRVEADFQLLRTL